jgi:hypothetical protein
LATDFGRHLARFVGLPNKARPSQAGQAKQKNRNFLVHYLDADLRKRFAKLRNKNEKGTSGMGFKTDE